MSDRRLVVAECDATSADKGKMFALAPGQAAGIGLPAFDLGNGVPAAGTVIGQGFYDKLHRRGFVWDGTAWKDIAPSPITAFATQALLVADTTSAIGTYATAGDTGNLFVKQASGWRMVGVVQYANATDLLADNPAKGTLGEAEDEDTLWERTATGWRLLVVREMADTTAILAWANGSSGATVGDRAIDLAHEVSYIRTSAGWRPTMLWEETEANIRASTWAVNGQEAISTDTGRTFIRTGGAWVEEPIQHFATDAALKAATPADGTLAWADDTAAVYARANGRWVGMNTGFSDPLPIGAISAFPTHTMPAGYLLCDGSTIPAGADYDELRRILGGTTVPDLRGQFLRGSSTAADTLLAKIGWTTGGPHTAFTTAEAGEHEHSLYYQTAGGKFSATPTATDGRWVLVDANGPAGVAVGGVELPGVMSKAGKHTHTISGGDTETAPDHVRICWGIKARHATVMPATALVVNTTAPKAGDALTYDGATSTWVNKTPALSTVVAATAPTAPQAGQEWFNSSTTGTIKQSLQVYDGSAWQSATGPSVVRLVARADFGASGVQRYWDGLNSKWVTVFGENAHRIELSSLVPVGHIAQLQMNVSGIYYHSSNLRIRGGFALGGMPGMSLSALSVPSNVRHWVQSSPNDNANNTASLNYSFTTVVAAGDIWVPWCQAIFVGSTNMDSRWYGGYEVLDMGPASAVTTLAHGMTAGSPLTPA